MLINVPKMRTDRQTDRHTDRQTDRHTENGRIFFLKIWIFDFVFFNIREDVCVRN